MKLGFAFALSLGLASVMTGCVLPSGHVRTETRNLGSFSRIELTGSPDVEVTFGPEQTVSVTADDNILPLIETRVTGDTLMIGSKGPFTPITIGSFVPISIGSYSTGSAGVKLNITLPALDGAKVTGSGNIVVNGVPGGHIEACVNGSGNITESGTAELFEAEINWVRQCLCSRTARQKRPRDRGRLRQRRGAGVRAIGCQCVRLRRRDLLRKSLRGQPDHGWIRQHFTAVTETPARFYRFQRIFARI